MLAENLTLLDMIKRLARISLLLTAAFAALTFGFIVSGRRSLPAQIGTIVFEMGYLNSNASQVGNLAVNLLKPSSILVGQQFDTLIDPAHAFQTGWIDNLDCAADGQSLLISAQRLYLLNVRNKALQPLNFSPKIIWALAWSPDRTRIALNNVDGSQRAISSMNLDGSNLSALEQTSNEEIDNSLAWSPDGRQIAAATDVSTELAEEFGIDIIDVATHGVRQIYHSATNVEQVAWSPDGKRIAFQLWQQGRFDIYTIQPDGSNLTLLTHDNQTNVMPRWSPDGSLISYSSLDASGHFQLYAMNADGSDPHLVFAAPRNQDALNLCWLKG